MRNELIGFGRPNDFSHIVARTEFSRKFGLFSKVPVWGGIKLHEYYPPLSTILVRYFSMLGALIIYFILNFLVWTLYRNPLTAILFLISYLTLLPLLYTGRFAECFGYTFILMAFFAPNPVSGIFLGIAALFHPLPLLIGSLILLLKFDVTAYLFAFLICGWWYVPFILKWKGFSYKRERRSDKIFGIYITSLSIIVNLFLFLFFPILAYVLAIACWVIPNPVYIDKNFKIRISKKWRFNFMLLKSKPYFISDLIKELPFLDKIKNSPIVILQKGKQLLSTGTWAWASACYLLRRGIIVYNGLPATDASIDKASIPSKIKVYKINYSD